MARRVSRAALSVLALLVAAATFAGRAAGAAAGASPVLVDLLFDDTEPVTGPDTIAIFEHARGRVRLTSDIVAGGSRALVLRDVPGDHDFPELQAFFPVRREGTVLVSFLLLTTDPHQELNAALAGPAGFRLGHDGIALWLATRDGFLLHVSDSIPRRVAPLEPFVWYRVDALYRIDTGRYDLTLHAEGRAGPVAALLDQPNAARAPGSAVGVLSFIGDDGDDLSGVEYFVDEVVVAAEPVPELPAFVAPARRRLFVDRLEGYDEEPGTSAPACPPALEPQDFGIRVAGGDGATTVKQLLAAASGAVEPGDGPARLAPHDAEAIRRWREGCAALARADFVTALESFDASARLAPDARLYPLGQALARIGLGRLDDAEILLGRSGRGVVADPRFGVVAARLAAARGFAGDAEAWLEGAVAAPVGGERIRFAQLGAFHWLMLEGRASDAKDFAARMVRQAASDAPDRARWIELGGDASFRLGDVAAARAAWQRALELDPGADPRLSLKLADAAHLQHDLDGERRLRERIYGRLRIDDGD